MFKPLKLSISKYFIYFIKGHNSFEEFSILLINRYHLFLEK